MIKVRINECYTCGETFTIYKRMTVGQAKCPKCKAKSSMKHNDGDRSIPVARKRIWGGDVLIESLPGEWFKMLPKNHRSTPYWRMRSLGVHMHPDTVSGDGKIGIFAYTTNDAYRNEPPQIGEVVRLRVMQSVHTVFDEDGNERMEKREYIVIEPKEWRWESVPPFNLDFKKYTGIPRLHPGAKYQKDLVGFLSNGEVVTGRIQITPAKKPKEEVKELPEYEEVEELFSFLDEESPSEWTDEDLLGAATLAKIGGSS